MSRSIPDFIQSLAKEMAREMDADDRKASELVKRYAKDDRIHTNECIEAELQLLGITLN